jgi:hypothetical protein
LNVTDHEVPEARPLSVKATLYKDGPVVVTDTGVLVIVDGVLEVINGALVVTNDVEAPVMISVNVVDSVMPAIPSTVIVYAPAGESEEVYIVSVLVRGSAPDAGLTE